MNSGAAATRARIEVVAGVLRDGLGRVLLAQRPAGKHLAGSWEFPGGKREPGERDLSALERELAEELGIVVESARPWLALTHAYPELTVRLKLFEVDAWQGEPRGHEGQALRWVEPACMNELPMPAADRPIVRALDLDPRYAISPDPGTRGTFDTVLDWARRCLDHGIRLFQLRAPSLDQAALRELAGAFGRLIRAGNGRWLLNASAGLAIETGADGVHLNARRLRQCRQRPLTDRLLVAASCHDEHELAIAGAIGVDFVTLSPVAATASHPGAETLGWDGFGRLCELAPVPVYALGGMTPDDLGRSRARGGFGVAGIRHIAAS